MVGDGATQFTEVGAGSIAEIVAKNQ